MTHKNSNQPYTTRTEKPKKTKNNQKFPPMGQLKNGNPAGNPNNAPRCGAKRRRNPEACKAPAMANGRCRLHGGLSTGPKTTEGLARSQRGNWKHGEFSKGYKADYRAFKKGLQLFLHPETVENWSLEELKEQHQVLKRINARIADEREQCLKRKALDIKSMQA